jgi:Arc/MetJ-type ribon-helix-helix transcriptional regulator
VSNKAMTLRLSPEQAAELEAVARADHQTVSETVRDAIGNLIEERRKDKDFQARLRAMIKEEQKVQERLAS